MRKIKEFVRSIKDGYNEAILTKKLMLDTSEDIINSLKLDIQAYYNNRYSDPGTKGATFDSFFSKELGYGTSNDKRKMFEYCSPQRLSLGLLDSLYRSSGLVSKVIDLPAQDMLRQGYEIDDPTGKIIEFINDDNGLNLDYHLSRALPWSRLYGGSAIVLDIEDGLEPWEPVNINVIRNIRAAHTVDCGYISPQFDTSGIYTMPDLYRVNVESSTNLIHRDRLLIFDGIDAGIRNRISRGGWGESVIDYIFQPLQDLIVDLGIASTIMKDFTRKHYKFSDFREHIRSDNQLETIKAKFKLMNKLLSSANGVVMDSKDDLVQVTTTVTGIDKILDFIKWHFLIVTGIPHSKLFGESPGASLGEGGQAQNRDWYDKVHYMQATMIAPQIRKALRYVCSMMNVPIIRDIEFNSLWQESPQEKAATCKIQAETQAIWISSGVKTAQQVAEEEGFEWIEQDSVEDQGNDEESNMINKIAELERENGNS